MILLTRNKVFGMKMRYVYKYIGYSKKDLDVLMDRALTGSMDDKYYKVVHQIDPYHLIRFEYTKETPIVYTYSANLKNAASKILEVLLPLAKVQELKELSNQFNEAKFISMVFNNIKEMPDIQWGDKYTGPQDKISVEDVLGE